MERWRLRKEITKISSINRHQAIKDTVLWDNRAFILKVRMIKYLLSSLYFQWTLQTLSCFHYKFCRGSKLLHFRESLKRIVKFILSQDESMKGQARFSRFVLIYWVCNIKITNSIHTQIDWLLFYYVSRKAKAQQQMPWKQTKWKKKNCWKHGLMLGK